MGQEGHERVVSQTSPDRRKTLNMQCPEAREVSDPQRCKRGTCCPNHEGKSHNCCKTSGTCIVAYMTRFSSALGLCPNRIDPAGTRNTTMICDSATKQALVGVCGKGSEAHGGCRGSNFHRACLYSGREGMKKKKRKKMK